MPGHSNNNNFKSIPGGDPRRPDEIKRYQREEIDAAEPSSGAQDPILFLSIIFGMLALIFKFKMAAWASLFSCVSGIANMRTDPIDFKQIISSITFSVMGIVATYIVPIPQK